MSAISSVSSSSEQHALLIYTRTNDNTFDDGHYNAHQGLLGQAFKVESIRTGMLDKPLFLSLGSSQKYALIEIAAHGSKDSVDLGDERLTMDFSKRGKLQELVNRLNAHGVLVLQTCRSGAVVANGRCFAEYLASLSDKPIRVIANQGTLFKLEFRRSNPVDVRYINGTCDQTAWFYRRPDENVVRMDLDLVDRLQKKLVDPMDRELANRIAAGFGVEDFIERFSELKLSIDDFKETRWHPLFVGVSDAVCGNLLKLAILDRYGAILQHLDVDHRKKAMIALFGGCPDLSINMETFPEYLLCCLEIEGTFPVVMQERDFGVVVGRCDEHYAHDLPTLLENMTIDASFVQGTVWESYLERLALHKAELGGGDLEDFIISPDFKRGEVVEKEGSIFFGLVPVSAYQKCRRNLLALAAVERYCGLFIHLDNGKYILKNPAGRAFCKMTGCIVHPKELPFARSLGRGTTSVFALVEKAFEKIDRGTEKECNFFRYSICKSCLNFLYKEVSDFLQPPLMKSFDDLIVHTGMTFKSKVLKKLNIENEPTEYNQKGFKEYHQMMTVENFIEAFFKNQKKFGLIETFEESRVKREAVDLGYLKKSELKKFFREAKLKDYLSHSNKEDYRRLAEIIIGRFSVFINQSVVVNEKMTTPLHIAAKNKDAFLVRCLIKLGAYVDTVDSDGFTARHYARDLDFLPRGINEPKSILQGRGKSIDLQDILTCRAAYGTFNFVITLCGIKKSLFSHAWDFFSINQPAPKIAASEILKKRVGLNFEQFDLSSSGRKVNERMDHIIEQMDRCIVLLAEFIEEHPGNDDDTMIRMCLERSAEFSRHWNELEKVVDFLRMSELEEMTQLIYSAEVHLSHSEMLERLISKQCRLSILLLYSYFSEDPDYIGLFNRCFSSISHDSLMLLIGKAFTRIDLLHEHHEDLADKIAGGVLECVLNRIDGGPEALATFIVERKYSQLYHYQTRRNLFGRLDRNQKMFIYVKGRSKQFYGRLVRLYLHGDGVAIEDERAFTRLAGEPPFVEAYLGWLKSLNKAKVREYVRANNDLLMETNGTAARNRLFSRVRAVVETFVG